MQPMEVDDSLTDFRRPTGSRRLSGPRPNHLAGTAGVGLGSWGLLAWPVTTAVSIISGAWCLFSTSSFRSFASLVS
jgi:hypothetical protein